MPGQERRILFELAAAVEASRPVVLATVVGTRRSAPRHSGTKMLIFDERGDVRDHRRWRDGSQSHCRGG